MGKSVEWQEIACGDTIRVCKSASAVNEVVDTEAPPFSEEEGPVNRVVLFEGNEMPGEVAEDAVSQDVGDGLIQVSARAFAVDVVFVVTKIEVKAVLA